MKILYNHKNQKGSILIMFAIGLIGIIGAAALTLDVGSWYLVEAEMSKAVDAAALAGAKNIANPHVDVEDVAEDFGRENFSLGYLGTPSAGSGAVQFDASIEGFEVTVEGNVKAGVILGGIFGVDGISVAGEGVAKRNKVEIMLVLDRSGSMAGTPIRDLKRAAINFLNNFEDTEDEDKVGLVSFATSVIVDRALGSYFVAPMTTAINAMTATGATNAEDALWAAGDEDSGGLSDQTSIPGDERVQQFVIFFSDGNPTAFKGTFKHLGKRFEAVVCGTGNDCATVYQQLGKPNVEQWIYYGDIGLTPSTTLLDPRVTGDGMPLSSSPCNQNTTNPAYETFLTTKWDVFQDYPIDGYSVEAQCFIPQINYDTRKTYDYRTGRYVYTYTLRSVAGKLASYVGATARQMARDHAQELKDRYIQIYTIGLGAIDRDFLGDIASGEDYEFYAPSSDELDTLFDEIAKDIKLRLVR